MPKVFLSHSWKDKAFARKLAEQLRLNGVEVWIDEAELRVGDSLIQKIGGAVNDADYIAVILSHSSVQSNWVQQELSMAMVRELSAQNVKILPILIEPCEIPPFLRDKLYADFTNPENFDSAFARVLKALEVSKPTNVSTPSISVSPDKSATASELEDFEDIQIVDVDKDKTYKPDENKGLFNVYLGLSSRPSAEWVEFFDAERNFPRHTMWRRAWIESKFIVIHCVPDELKKYHLRDLKEDVSKANSNYRDYLRRETHKRNQKVRQETEELRALDDVLDDLNFKN